MKTSDKAYFCPSCGSASLSISALAGGECDCLNCPWVGVKEDLDVYIFQHESGSNDEMLLQFASDFKTLIGRHVAAPLAKLLFKWGFFTTNPPAPEELTRYAIAVGKASVQAILAVKKELEAERVHATTTQN